MSIFDSMLQDMKTYSEGAIAMAEELISKHDEFRAQYPGDEFGYFRAMEKYVDAQVQNVSALKATITKDI